MRDHLVSLLPVLLLALAPRSAAAREVTVSDRDALRAAAHAAAPGDVIRIAPGEYAGGVFLEGLTGREGAPIVIEAADPARPPVFAGGGEGLHLVRPVHVVLRNVVVRGARDNGINVDDGGTFATAPAHHLTLEGVVVERIGPRGNHDGIKLSGLTDFTLRGCRVEGWGGSAVDMVGCHRGRIEGCTFTGLAGFGTSSGVQCKGGTAEVTIRRCTFLDAGSRAVNVGGSTGLEWFRPLDASSEARAITVEGCRFRGSEAPIAFVGVDGAVVRWNTFYRPGKWVARILQETTGERFVPCRGGRFEHNLIVFRRADVRVAVNVGPDTAPATFAFARNWWFAEDGRAPADSRLELPVPEEGAVWGRDPGLDPETLEVHARSPARAAAGADGLRER